MYEQNAEKKGYCHFQHRAVSTMPAHFHSAPEFVFLETGSLDVTIDGEKRTLRAGEACFADGFCVHSYGNKPNSVAFVLLGDKAYFENAFSLLGGKPPRFFSFDDFALLSFLHSLCEQNGQGRYAIFEGAVGVLLGAIAQNTPFEAREDDKQSALVCQILRFAESHSGENLSLGEIARRFGYSHEHLSRLLHKYLSENWNGYVNRLRVRKARQLLQETDDNVLKIAFDCGFESPNTFYRAYKKEFGENPRKINF